MRYLDFHHHKPSEPTGIYNLSLMEAPPIRPFSAGIHPADSGSADAAAWAWLETALQNPMCTALGECGLDALAEPDIKIQEMVFKKQILLANKAKKPIIIHCVRLFHRLHYFRKFSSVPMIIHGFNKKASIAEELLREGFYLSFGKAALHSVSLQNIIKNTPLEKLFLETDDADFDIANLYKWTSETKGIEPGELLRAAVQNLSTIQKL